MSGLKLSQAAVAWIIGLCIMVLFSIVLFGMAGARTIIGIVLLFIVPAYFLMRRTVLDFEEKIFFSLFIGLGLFPLLAWSLNQLLPSFRLSVIAAFVLVAAVGLFVPRILARLKKKKQ